MALKARDLLTYQLPLFTTEENRHRYSLKITITYSSRFLLLFIKQKIEFTIMKKGEKFICRKHRVLCIYGGCRGNSDTAAYIGDE